MKPILPVVGGQVDVGGLLLEDLLFGRDQAAGDGAGYGGSLAVPGGAGIVVGMQTDRIDFRDQADQASRRLLTQSGIDPLGQIEDLGRSLCLRVDEDSYQRLRRYETRLSIIAIVGLVICFSTLGAGLLIHLLGLAGRPTPAAVWITNVVFTVASFVLFFKFILFLTRRRKDLIYQILSTRPSLFVDRVAGETFSVCIEQPRRWQAIALSLDDAGTLLCDLRAGRLLIDAVGYRYVVYREDVIALIKKGGKAADAIRLSYRIGDEELLLDVDRPFDNTRPDADFNQPQNLVMYEALEQFMQQEC